MTTENLNKILEDSSLSQASKDKLAALHENISGKEFSDLLDQSGNQYIEFVQEGGGVWGSALVGYLYGLEIFGIRFLKVAGTSAGAINTMLIAACKTKEESKSELIKDILFSWDFSDFMDGKTYVKTTLHAMLNNKNFFKINAIIAAILFIILISIPFLASSTTILNAKLMFLIPLIPAVILFFCIQKLYHNFRKENSGLNPGNVFQNTMQNALDQFGIKTVANLNEKFIQKERDLNLNYRYGNGQEYYTRALQSIEKIKIRNILIRPDIEFSMKVPSITIIIKTIRFISLDLNMLSLPPISMLKLRWNFLRWPISTGPKRN